MPNDREDRAKRIVTALLADLPLGRQAEVVRAIADELLDYATEEADNAVFNAIREERG